MLTSTRPSGLFCIACRRCATLCHTTVTVTFLPDVRLSSRAPPRRVPATACGPAISAKGVTVESKHFVQQNTSDGIAGACRSMSVPVSACMQKSSLKQLPLGAKRLRIFTCCNGMQIRRPLQGSNEVHSSSSTGERNLTCSVSSSSSPWYEVDKLY